MNPESVVKRFEMIGICVVDVAEVVRQWNKSWYISQWKEEYTLCHHSRGATNFTRTDLKVKISKQQAKEIIVELDLMPELSPVLVSGKTWRKAQ